MRFRTCLSVVCLFLSALSVFGQDLPGLQSRVSTMWNLRKQSQKAEALSLVEPETRNIFLQLNESPISDFKVVGLEFTNDVNANRVDVLVNVRSVAPQVGEFNRTIKETWVWKDKQWFLHAAPPPTMFDSDTERRQPSVRPELQITDAVLDLGRHAQGESIEGRIRFRAKRGEIVLIRPLQRIAGLSISTPTWTSPTEGHLAYTWETTLISQNVDQTLTFEGITPSDDRVTADLKIRVRIDGKIGFKQKPEILDPSKAGEVELQIQNLTSKTLKILSAASYNINYVIDDNITESIEPGKSGRLLIRYTAQTRPAGAALGLAFSEALNASGLINVPLNVQLPEEKRPVPLNAEDARRLCAEHRDANCGAQAPPVIGK